MRQDFHTILSKYSPWSLTDNWSLQIVGIPKSFISRYLGTGEKLVTCDVLSCMKYEKSFVDTPLYSALTELLIVTCLLVYTEYCQKQR